jgi:hypothetical protein
MQSLIQKITTKAASLDFTTSGIGTNNKGLDKLTELKGLTLNDMNFIYAMYLDDAKALVLFRAFMLKWANEQGLCSETNALKVTKGALLAYKINAYRIVECYKCKGKGCERCGNTGKTSKKPRAHELCGMNRNTWYNKNNAPVRELFDKVGDKLSQIESEINSIYNKNKHDIA